MKIITGVNDQNVDIADIDGERDLIFAPRNVYLYPFDIAMFKLNWQIKIGDKTGLQSDIWQYKFTL